MSTIGRRHVSSTNHTTAPQQVRWCCLFRPRRPAVVTVTVAAWITSIMPGAGCRDKQEPQRAAETTVEGKLCFFMVFGGVSDQGVSLGPPTFFIESNAGTYLLTIGSDCKLVNANKLRELPGFERLIEEGTSEIGPPGSGPVMAVPGTVRVRGTLLPAERPISGKYTEELRAYYLEHIEQPEAGAAKP